MTTPNKEKNAALKLNTCLQSVPGVLIADLLINSYVFIGSKLFLFFFPSIIISLIYFKLSAVHYVMQLKTKNHWSNAYFQDFPKSKKKGIVFKIGKSFEEICWSIFTVQRLKERNPETTL